MNATISRLACLGVLLVTTASAGDVEPPALNPFARNNTPRDDAQPGYIELSDGSVWPGTLFLPRDTRLRIYDEQLRRQREVPLSVVRSVVCKIEKEWMEREWRFQENANDAKLYTGRRYPARQYRHEITLKDDRQISGSMSGIVYLSPYKEPDAKPTKFLLNKRDKGPVGSELESLVFLKKFELGEEAMRKGQLLKRQLQTSPVTSKSPATKPVTRKSVTRKSAARKPVAQDAANPAAPSGGKGR